MNYNMTKPCDSCPFRRDTSMRLTKGRIREIVSMMLSPNGGTFPCHKTTEFDDDEGEYITHDKEVHCAGALIFADKNGNQTQMMRIAGRLGMFNPTALEPHYDEIFDSVEEMCKELSL